MALVLKDRVQETTTTTGTGTLTLGGAVLGYQTFAAIGDANTTYYAISSNTSAEWEVGIGTYTASGTTLARTTVLASSNAGAAVNLSAGTKNVFCTYPSSRSIYAEGTTITATNSAILPLAFGGTGSSTLTANNVLLGNGTSALQVVAPGTTGNVLTSNGTTWTSSAPSSGFSNMVVVSANNASYSIPATKIKITVVGGGGAAFGAAGGGGGGAIKTLSGLTIANTLNITIGTGGTFNSSNGAANSGNTSSVASGTQSITTVSATGGGGATNGGAGSGGSGSSGDLNFTGNPGQLDLGWCPGTSFGGSSAILGRPYGQGGGNLTGGANGSAGLVIVEY